MSESDLRVPVVAEEAFVTTRDGATERVRVRTSAEQREELVTGDLRVEALEIERRRVERLVDTAPPPREEGDTTIISVVEERAVVTRQLVVVEEIVIRRRVEQQSFAVPFALRRTRVDVERATPSPDPSPQEKY